MLIWPRPSRLREVMRLTPATLLTASSMGLMTSRSTASGDAPGYSTSIHTPGRLMSGICSTPSLAYENRPSTHSATITMAANTGFWIETRVIHMAGS